MKTPAEIKAIVDNHTQMRRNSCFQSAVEMALKLYGVIDADSYPEQAIVENDGQGLGPFKGKKTYGATTVAFNEEKFEPISDKALNRTQELIKQEIYPVLSLAWPDGSGFHGFVAYINTAGDLKFITKNGGLGKRFTEIWEHDLIWPRQKKTEILVVRIL